MQRQFNISLLESKSIYITITLNYKHFDMPFPKFDHKLINKKTKTRDHGEYHGNKEQHHNIIQAINNLHVEA